MVFAARNCSHYLPPVLPPVSLIPMAICDWHCWHRRKICHLCQHHERNWWQNLPPVSFIPVANLPPVSLTPVVHLDLWISPRIFQKVWNDPNVIFRAWGKVIHEKNLKQKISWHCPFKEILWIKSPALFLVNCKGHIRYLSSYCTGVVDFALWCFINSWYLKKNPPPPRVS